MPTTSLDAYKSLQPDQIEGTYKAICFALGKIGEGTFEDIASFLRMDKSKVWKRLSELCKADLIYRPGNKRPLRSGRSGYTWRLTDKSLPKTQNAEKAFKGPSVADYSRKLIPEKKPSQPSLF